MQSLLRHGGIFFSMWKKTTTRTHTQNKSGTPIFFCSDEFEFLRIEPVAHPMQKYKSTLTTAPMYYVGIVYPAALSL